MTQHNTLNVKLSNLQLNKSKFGIKNGTEVTLNLSFGGSNDDTNFLHKSFLTDRQVLRLYNAFANNSSANIKLSKTQLPEIVQLGGLLTPLLPDIVPDILSGKVTPETIAIDLIKNNKDFPKSEKGISFFLKCSP